MFFKGAALSFRHSANSAKVLRRLSSTKALQLEYREYKSDKTNKGNIFILHGLLGNKNNWHTLCRHISEETGKRIICPDLRNHGQSPHDPDCRIESMHEDIIKLMDDTGCKSTDFIAHSLGGKIAMHLALKNPDLVNRLIIVDMPPVEGMLSNTPLTMLKVMLEIDSEKKFKTIKELNEALRPEIPKDVERNFILTCSNLVTPNQDPKSNFRANIKDLEKNYSDIWRFPLKDSGLQYLKECLFLVGKRSEYYHKDYASEIKKFFPKSNIKLMNSGHWVQTEDTQNFLKECIEFISKENPLDA